MRNEQTGMSSMGIILGRLSQEDLLLSFNFSTLKVSLWWSWPDCFPNIHFTYFLTFFSLMEIKIFICHFSCNKDFYFSVLKVDVALGFVRWLLKGKVT